MHKLGAPDNAKRQQQKIAALLKALTPKYSQGSLTVFLLFSDRDLSRSSGRAWLVEDCSALAKCHAVL